MMIPDYQSLMLPLLKKISDGKEYKYRDLVDLLAHEFNITTEEREELLPSGQQPIFDNRVGWAKTYLKKAGLLESPKRAIVKISQRGGDILKQNPIRINVKYLKQFDEFIEFQGLRHDKKEIDLSEEILEEKNPEELLELSFTKITNELASDILEKVKSCSPRFFENLVVDLLIKMGYGGSKKEAGRAIGKTGDGGIDGIIKEDKLGLDIIYIQAKRYNGTVPIKEVRDFAGSLLGKKARKGIFLTSGNYPHTAYDYVSNIEPKIILIEGKELAKLMIENNIGTTIHRSYELKRMDSDYFEEL
ncbi:MAG: restriction endonuclease [Cyclobacteriaceae bacterium]|nr:restriction endonuclease [Cyclobacteriaceae bacterium]